jgi:hypothetical protein
MLRIYQFSKLKYLELSRFKLLKFISLVTLFVITLLITHISVYSAQITLQWEPNSEPDLAGYIIYVGYSSRNYQSAYDVTNYTSCTITNLEEGRSYFFAAKAYDIHENASDFSEEVSCTIPAPLPSPTPPEPTPTPPPPVVEPPSQAPEPPPAAPAPSSPHKHKKEDMKRNRHH